MNVYQLIAAPLLSREKPRDVREQSNNKHFPPEHKLLVGVGNTAVPLSSNTLACVFFLKWMEFDQLSGLGVQSMLGMKRYGGAPGVGRAATGSGMETCA